MIRKLAHLCLVTDQLESLTAFYTQKLGFSLQFTFRHDDGGVFGHYLATGDSTFIEIFDRVGKHKQWGGGGKIDPLTYGNRLNHLCFEVTDIEATKRTLEGRGAKLTDIKTGMDHSRQMWTNDPDGNPIELMEYTHASWQLNPPKS
jgi:lactoylglutathione lyase